MVAIAVTLYKDELVIDDDADADAGRIPVFQSLFHERVKALKLLGHFRALVLGVNRYAECEGDYDKS